MSMDRNMKWQAGKDYKRTSEVKVSSNFQVRAEAITLAHAAVGNMAEYQLMFSSMGKVDPQVKVEELSNKIDKFMGLMIAEREGMKVEEVSAEDDDEGG